MITRPITQSIAQPIAQGIARPPVRLPAGVVFSAGSLVISNGRIVVSGAS